jgi:ribosomal-protein-alanine N-acetyltransferase
MLDKILSYLLPGRIAVRKAKAQKIKSTFKDPPELFTERILLRRIVPSDAYDMNVYASREDVTRFLTWSPHAALEETHEYIEYLQGRYAAGQFYDWGIQFRPDGRFIGTCGFTSINLTQNKAEVGYVLSPFYWGRRIMPEVLRMVICFGFEQFGFDKIEARYIEGNDRSAGVMKSCGMKYESTLYRGLLVRNEYRTVHTFSVTREEFFQLGIRN